MLEKKKLSQVPNSLEVELRNSIKYGAWYQYLPESCKICGFTNVDEIHKLAYNRVSFDNIVQILKKEYGFETSKATLSRHFKYHFLVADNYEVVLTKSELDVGRTSIDDLIQSVEEKKVTLIESVSKIARSKLEHLKKLEEVSHLLECELHLSSEDGLYTGFTATDKHNDNLFKRWAFIQKEINNAKNELSSIFFNVQNVLNKTDQENIKNFIQLTKLSLIEGMVSELSNALINLRDSGVITADQAVKIGKVLTKILKVFETQTSVDMLFQQALSKMQEQDDDSVG
ncbi:MAG: hypothetical protein ABIK31_03300 [candidate division WOR-3 bacterium]